MESYNFFGMKNYVSLIFSSLCTCKTLTTVCSFLPFIQLLFWKSGLFVPYPVGLTSEHLCTTDDRYVDWKPGLPYLNLIYLLTLSLST